MKLRDGGMAPKSGTLPQETGRKLSARHTSFLWMDKIHFASYEWMKPDMITQNERKTTYQLQEFVQWKLHKTEQEELPASQAPKLPKLP